MVSFSSENLKEKLHDANEDYFKAKDKLEKLTAQK